MSKTITLILALAAIVVLSGCVREYHSESSYFNGAVAVEYKQTKTGNSDDYMTFRFYGSGIYEVNFSDPHGENLTRGLPKDFKQEIGAEPREIIVKQHVLPDFIRVTIKKDNQTEFHDFS